MLPSRIRTHRCLSIPTTKTILPNTRPLSSQLHKPHAKFRQFTNTPSSNMTDNNHPIATGNIPSSAPGENFEPRQTHPSEDYTPDPSKSIPLPPNRQALVDDIIDLYSCKPTVEKVKRYTPDCVYDDQFVYANDRYKMAGQWFALPKLFKASKNEGYQIVKNDPGLIQFRNAQVSVPHISSLLLQKTSSHNPLQSWTFKIIPKTATINALVSLSLEPSSADSDFIRVKYHKDQANDKDYSHEGLGFSFKKWQADQVMKHMDSPEVKEFEADKGAAKEAVKQYGSGGPEGGAPVKEL